MLREVIPKNPLDGVRVQMKKEIPLWNVLHEGQEEKMIKAAVNGRDRAVLLALLQHGPRASELAAWTWADVRDEGGRFTITWIGKNRKPLVKRLKTRTVDAAREWCATLGIEALPGMKIPLIPTRGHGINAPIHALDRWEIWSIVTSTAKAAKLKVTPHGLRATYISRLIKEQGIEAARQAVGHDDIDTTQRYSRWAVLDDHDDPVVKKKVDLK
jgi:integrase